MAHDDELDALLKKERQVRWDPAGKQRVWSRLDGSVRSGRRALPIAAAPLALGLSLFASKALAAALVVGVGSVVVVSVTRWIDQPAHEQTPARTGTLPGSGEAARTSAPWRSEDSHATSLEAPLVPQPPSGESPLVSDDPGRGRHPASTRAGPAPLVEAPARASEASAPPAPHQDAGPLRDQDAAPFAEELELLGKAKGALDRGEAARAQRWLDEHATRFPRGVFASERDALRVVLGCTRVPGQGNQAAARRYLEAYPRSLHGDRIARACRLGNPEVPVARFPDDAESRDEHDDK